MHNENNKHTNNIIVCFVVIVNILVKVVVKYLKPENTKLKNNKKCVTTCN